MSDNGSHSYIEGIEVPKEEAHKARAYANYFERPILETAYGDVQELPNSLLKEMYDEMFAHKKHLHPNQKYREYRGEFCLAIIAGDTANKYIKPLLKEIEELKAEVMMWKEKANESLPNECLLEEEVKFCFHGNGGGEKCKKCAF